MTQWTPYSALRSFMPVSTLPPFEGFHLNLYFFFTEVTPSILCDSVTKTSLMRPSFNDLGRVRARLGGGLAENRGRRAGVLHAGDRPPLVLDERVQRARRHQLRRSRCSHRGRHAHDHVRVQRGRNRRTLGGLHAAPRAAVAGLPSGYGYEGYTGNRRVSLRVFNLPDWVTDQSFSRLQGLNLTEKPFYDGHWPAPSRVVRRTAP